MENEMLRVDHVTKEYRLGMIGGTTLKEELQSRMARMRKQEDPNQKIGAKVGTRNEKFLALNDVSFSVKKGEAVGIIGHNGAGKSTLLKLITRITAPTSGEIGLNGRIASMLEVGTGFHPELTGRENVYMNGAILGMTKAEIDKKMEDIIEFSEVRQFIDTPVKRYSSGMYVKLAFSVAAHLDSEIMIMDEVLAVGDMAFQQKCLKKMSDAAKKDGRTVLYVSHNMMTIRQLCDRCLVMEKGHIIYDGDVERAINLYMGNVMDELPVYYDLIDKARPSDFHGQKIRISSLRFLDKEIAKYKSSELLRFTLNFIANEKLDGLMTYFTIRSESDYNVGTTQTYSSFCNVEKGKEYSVTFSLSIKSLAAGKYWFRPDLFCGDNFGNRVSYDNIPQNIVFEVTDDDSKGIRWIPRYYGYIRLDEIKIENICCKG